MKILAFHNYASHDAGAAVLSDEHGTVRVATISEERLSRVKNSYFFPVRAIDTCMAEMGVESLAEFDVIATDYSFKRRLLNTNLRYRKLEADYIKTKLAIDFGKVLYVDHHAAHAASAFYASSYDAAAVLVVDGVGSEGNTNSLYVGNRSRGLQLVEKSYGTGIGLAYTAVTRDVLGFGLGEEGKTMGLAAIGQQFMADGPVLNLRPRYDGLVTDFGSFIWRSPSAALRHPLPRCEDDAARTSSYYSRIAWELQQETERCLLHLARYAFEKTGQRLLCLAGGVALNCVANERLFVESSFDDVFIQPAASDTGLPLGLALWAYYERHKGTGVYSFSTAFTGKRYGASPAKALLDEFNVPHAIADAATVAGLIAAKNIVGWFVEGSELGPRALGHRSILADPRSAAMKDTLNAKVKHREMFRPFAPSVLEERAADYFAMRGKSPFMLRAPNVRPEAVDRIPAVVHVDRSARVHTVNRRDNPLFYDLLAEFERLTGVPVVINTSFNDSGEPIVETPMDALICFLRTQMDYLFMDGVLIDRAAIQDDALLPRLLEHRSRALKAQYGAAIARLCRGYAIGELRAFLKAYAPMHRYYSSLHTLVALQDVLSSWGPEPVFTDAYHDDLIRRFLPEEHARVADQIVMVDDAYAVLPRLTDGSLVILFNTSLWLDGRPLRNFYAERWMTRLAPVMNHAGAESDLELSNEYRSSNDWDGLYRTLTDQQ